MNRLVIPVATVTNHGAEVDAELSGEILRTGTGDLHSGPIHVTGTVEAVDTELLFRGSLAGEWIHPCDRCLRPSETPYAVEVSWFFEPGAKAPGNLTAENETAEQLTSYEVAHDSDDAEPTRYFNGIELDLTESIREELLLAAPSKFLCMEDCEGLCAHCGANLNDGPCACPPDRGHGSGVLADLAVRLAELERSKPLEESKPLEKSKPPARRSKE